MARRHSGEGGLLRAVRKAAGACTARGAGKRREKRGTSRRRPTDVKDTQRVGGDDVDGTEGTLRLRGGVSDDGPDHAASRNSSVGKYGDGLCEREWHDEYTG